MEMYFETLQSYRIAYVRQVGPYGAANVEAMDRLKHWANDQELLTESAILLGIPQDDPASTPAQHCRYDAAIVMTKLKLVHSDAVEMSELSGGEYLICKVKHTAEDIQQAWNEIIPHLQKNHHTLDHTKPVMERYRYQLLKNHFCEICVPVKLV
ncbi:DNA gyrase inhibitor [Paenibacillus sp. Root52]|uniref:DNA gyrase inhibitor GyrI n=1 Tax=Paenibacillus amylolyticus TaxID=1451 RepID=A0AAP5H029_PAEAM|nr:MULTISPECIES: GyrI-like domain-containing protein [Paenibacillus]KQY94859.1 DNA gyrase inhibitor [Paenibacillus sp. Root52]MDR6723833.1 DNA gyrase inhibitor GyrI [Paenibacillus amylolyticus]